MFNSFLTLQITFTRQEKAANYFLTKAARWWCRIHT